MNERRLHNLKWTADKKCLTSNDSRSDRNQSNEENKPTNETTKEVHHSFDTAESLSRRISPVNHSKNSRLWQKLRLLYSPPIIPILSHKNVVHTLYLSLFWVTRTQFTPTCPYSESRKDKSHPLLIISFLSHKNTDYTFNLSLFLVMKMQSTPPAGPYSESHKHSSHPLLVPILSHISTVHTPTFPYSESHKHISHPYLSLFWVT